MNERERPAPEAFLRAAEREGRGRLKIFLGAAPGVGKTYEMLVQGAARQKAGIDIVVGIVETHGRSETQALTHALEVLPRRSIDYQGHVLTEMDIDALLERRPALALVDELAHTNAPESRHPKRWQDVEELLDAGIDVYSTLNIQHLESLNDVVASFTHVRVRETVPDSILEQAEIEVVDIPPAELIERLKDGKVYLPQEATRALAHFFSKTNLSALRELALRRAAQTVDAQMLEELRAQALGGTWAGSERILVAVSELPGAEALVRAAKRISDAAHAPWSAIHIETPRAQYFGEEEMRRIASALNLASSLGATVATVPAPNVVEGLKSYADEARATQLVVGKSMRSRWFEFRHGSIVDRLVRETPGVAVHVLPLDETAAAQPARPRHRGHWGKPSGYVWTTLLVAGVTAFGSALFHILDLGNVGLLYLLPVMVAASLFGLRTGLFAGIASSLAYNFFFLPPTGTLTINNPENIISIFVLLGVAIVTSQLTARVRAQADLAASSARTNAALAGYLRQLTALGDREEVGRTACQEIGRLLNLRVLILERHRTGLIVQAASEPGVNIETMELAAAQWVLDTGQPAGRGTGSLTASDWQFQPLRAGERVLAVMGFARDDGRDPIRSDQLPLLTSLLDQTSLALERLRLESEMRDIDKVRERDRLRAALLSSVSHDLRTPLTAVLGAAAELRKRSHDPLLDTIESEALRLNRFVANLLDMARVEAGALRLHVEAVDLTDAVSSAVHDARRSLEGHPIQLDVPPNLPLVNVDPQLFHHCLLNLLDNAGRYGDPGAPITIRAERTYGELILSVLDQGPGLPPGQEKEVFETFKRLEGSDRSVSGTGLGLAIVKGFAEGMGIAVDAGNRPDGIGARFSLHFPEPLLTRTTEQDQHL
ncbi:osmosensitive K+ channel signal transduction histidine kinase [Sphingobium chlorophenolicum L-1]|uniref:histidine kinase n=1 Tax=Sphingobium chlorophenolicum L-1 TaxID=690566 RepID=F6EU89_SPHCR|nr:sensor histidine kinase KdpD [Sphingobium chlorophenolicum]AEG48718.1 osmosensitive K+ channel signal transduction histidine kinase [Sphingobium chlorophenolicum L-1]